MTATEAAAESRDLTIKRRIDAAPAAVWRAWTEPELLKRWFAPAPWTTPHAELDVRPGGGNLIVMRGPDGAEFPNRGVYLEVTPERRLVFTDAYVRAW
ncbi:MAG TPA: SRPBCC domain-containing protein, partial [Caulobacteraceae bacterium]